MSLSVYQVAQGIFQSIHNAHHGAVNEDGSLVEIGLKREDQPIKDQRVIDGFGVSMQGNLLIIRYSSHEPLASLHDKKFNREMERRIEEIKKFIQKEFLKHTKNNLKLKETGEVKVLVETSNRVKAMIKAMMAYEVLNLKDKVDIIGCSSCTDKIKEIEDRNKAMMKKVLKPKNVTRKEK